MKVFCTLLSIPLFFTVNLSAQNTNTGTITGSVVDGSTKLPMEFVNTVLYSTIDSTLIKGTVTDKSGTFNLNNIPYGEYYIKCSFIGYKEKKISMFRIDAAQMSLNLGTIALIPSTVKLNEVVIAADKQIFETSIDRKVYNVDQDVTSKAGSASELLQNVPSVQVDIDGNVSLRGSSNVSIMLNGKTSPLMDNNAATVLQQMPANSIEKIEVITNPSAKYKPDGTSGIINIVLKKNATLGINGNITANAGNDSRFNGNLRLNYNPGDLNIYGSYSFRRDGRNRVTTDTRDQTDSASTVTHYNENLFSFARPVSHVFAAGLDDKPDELNSFGISGDYFHNTFTRTDNSKKILQDNNRIAVSNYDRDRIDYEYHNEFSVTSYLQHNFTNEDNKLRLEYNYSVSPEQEDNHFTNSYLLPSNPSTYDNTLIKQNDKRSQLSLDYSNPLTENSGLEAGYAGEFNSNDLDFHAETFDTSQQQFVNNAAESNRFLFDESINALYATYRQSFGQFGFMAGLRTEQANRTSDLANKDSVISDNYFNIYPSLHLSYKLNNVYELQLSYSKRTNRPRGEDLNPFPEYRDPRNVSAGNPGLLPEYIHSVEFGCQFQNDQFSILPSVYYRYAYNKFTSIVQALNDTTLLTTRQNLSSDQSGGMEVIVTATVGDLLTAHASANGFYEKIDASNLGYAENKSTTTWSSNLTLSLNLAKNSKLQINSNYNSSRLTPQGTFLPSYGVNMGFRQEMMEGKISLIFTVSDLFKTQKRQLELTTPLLNQTVVNTRDSRVAYLGFTYHLGIPAKKTKEEQIHYDDN